MLRSLASKIPMKISVPLLLAAPVFIAVVVVSMIAYNEAKSTAKDLIEQNLARIHDHIEERLKDLLNLPNRIQQVNASLIREDKLNLKDLRSWRQILFDQAGAFKGLSSIAWGGSDGRSVRIARFPEEYGYEFAIRDEFTGSNLDEYFLDAYGRTEKTPRDSYPYDPRSQPWYKAALMAEKPTWTEPYAKEHGDAIHVNLALGYVQPFHDSNGNIIGVMNAEMTLNDISFFLETLSVGRTGKAFLIDHRGRLIATSTGVPVTDAKYYPIRAAESYDREIAAAAKHIENAFGSFNNIEARYQLSLRIMSTPYLLMISPSEHETGLRWIIATLVPESDFMVQIKTGRQRSIKIGIIAVIITLCFGIIFAAISLWPMLDLVKHVQRIGKGILDQELKLEYSTEFVQLSKEINSMTAGLRDRMRLRDSLALAQEVQQNLLPSDTPNIDGLDIAGHAIYCDETGGDYFDFLEINGLPKTTAAITVGDVVGHGVAAAMLMATARGILRSRCRQPGSLADLLTHLNDMLVKDTGEDRFMTMLLMTVDANLKEMRWAAAGHEAPLVYDQTEKRFIELKSSSMSLGLKKDVVYEEHRFMEVKQGQIFMALTDGLPETFNKSGEMFGMQRVQNVIQQYAHLSATELCQQINTEVSRFRGDASAQDDLTFVLIKVL